MSDIVVSGLGLITALGSDVVTSFDRLIKGEHAAFKLELWDVSDYKTDLAAAIKFKPRVTKAKSLKCLDRGHQLLLSAAKEAIEDAGLLDFTSVLRVGIIVGTSLAGMESMQTYDSSLYYHGKGLLAELINEPLHVSADLLADEFGFNGPRLVVSTACTASTIAIGCAIAMLRNNKADVVIAAGCDPLSYISYTGFSCMRNMSGLPSSPFSEHIGLNLGEGAAALVLEGEALAKHRKVRHYVYARDYMFSADAYHVTSPDPRGISHQYLLETLLKKTNMDCKDIDYINMHGTGTEGNDIAETKVVDRLFYQSGYEVPVSSVKGAIGHTLGAAGAVESVLTIKSMKRGYLLPTANFTKPREGCVLDYVPNVGRKAALDSAIVQNFAFGGNNAGILFSKYRPKPTVKNKRRVVVTGMSVISPLGNSFETIAENIKNNVSAIEDAYSEEYQRYFKAARLKDFNPRIFVKANFRRMDRLSQLIVSATHMALSDAGLNPKKNQEEYIGLVSGTMFGHVESNLSFHRDILNKKPESIDPFKFPNTVTNAGSGQASVISRLKGCNIALSAGQASGLAAINLASDLIKDGLHSVIIAGGADELTDYQLYNFYRAGFSRAGIKQPPKLLDRLVMNEGASYFVLEDYEHAVNRAAKIYAEIMECEYGAIDFKLSDKIMKADRLIPFFENFIHQYCKDNTINTVYSSALNYKDFVNAELSSILSNLGYQPQTLNLHNNLGMSALTSTVTFGLACLGDDRYSLVTAASLGGALYANMVKKWPS